MKSLLFALGLALCCFVQANQDTVFGRSDLSKIEGPWIFGGIRSNCEKMNQMMKGMPASNINFKEGSENELQMAIDMRTEHGCKKMEVSFEEGTDGRYTGICGKGVKKTIGNIYRDENVMFTSMEVSHGEGQCKVAGFFAKDQASFNSFLAAFNAFGGRNGLKDEETRILPTKGMCPRSS